MFPTLSQVFGIKNSLVNVLFCDVVNLWRYAKGSTVDHSNFVIEFNIRECVPPELYKEVVANLPFIGNPCPVLMRPEQLSENYWPNLRSRLVHGSFERPPAG